jgi:hypothetical protein
LPIDVCFFILHRHLIPWGDDGFLRSASDGDAKIYIYIIV